MLNIETYFDTQASAGWDELSGVMSIQLYGVPVIKSLGKLKPGDKVTLAIDMNDGCKPITQVFCSESNRLLYEFRSAIGIILTDDLKEDAEVGSHE